MLGGFKNEKELQNTLSKWNNLSPNQHLIHTLNHKGFFNSNLSTSRVDDVFKTWDVISTSFVDLNTISSSSEKLAGWDKKNRNTGLWFEVGLILAVPAQNILGTHSRDVWFPNHAGVTNGRTKNSYALSDAIFSGKGKNGGQHAWPSASGQNYNTIKSPDEILKATNTKYHNEILVIGKGNIMTYPGFPATRPVRLIGIIIAKKQLNGHGLFQRMGQAKNNDLASRILHLNPGVDVYEI